MRMPIFREIRPRMFSKSRLNRVLPTMMENSSQTREVWWPMMISSVNFAIRLETSPSVVLTMPRTV